MRFLRPGGNKKNSSILRRVLWARGLRAFGDGYTSLLLPAYLTSLGMNAFQVGVITTGTLLGSAVLTLLLGMQAHRFRKRTLLLAAAVLMLGTGVGLALITDFWPLLVVAVVGTLNPSSGDVSVFLPLEHAVLSRVALLARAAGRLLSGRHLCGRPLSLRDAGDPGLRQPKRDLAAGFRSAGRPSTGRLRRGACPLSTRRPDSETPAHAAAVRPVTPVDLAMSPRKQNQGQSILSINFRQRSATTCQRRIYE